MLCPGGVKDKASAVPKAGPAASSLTPLASLADILKREVAASARASGVPAMLNEPPAPSRSPLLWKSIGIGAGLTLVLVATILFYSLYQSAPSGQQQNAYASHLVIENAQVSQADTMMAGSVTYWNADLVNQGDRTVTSCTVTLAFLDPYGKTVQTETENLVNPKTSPLRPHDRRHLQIGFEKVSFDWNQAPPKVIFQSVFVK